MREYICRRGGERKTGMAAWHDRHGQKGGRRTSQTCCMREEEGRSDDRRKSEKGWAGIVGWPSAAACAMPISDLALLSL